MHLTWRSFLLAAGVALLGIAGTWTGGHLEPLWQLAAAALVAALLVEGRMVRRQPLRIQRTLPARARLGEFVHGELEIANPAPVARRAFVLDLPPGALEGSGVATPLLVPAGGRSRQRLRLLPTRPGTFRWGPIQTRVLGHFGLAWWSGQQEVPAGLQVTPASIEGRACLPGWSRGGEAAHQVPGSGMELLALRSRQPGDPLRSVDWKATARRGQPVVRVYAEERQAELFLVLDVGRTSGERMGRLSRLHHQMNVAARLSQRAMARGDRVGLVTYADAPVRVLAPRRDAPGLRAIRAELAAAAPRLREANPLPALLEVRRIARHRSLVVVLTALDEGEAAEQLLEATRLLLPKHQPLVAGLLDEAVLALAEQGEEGGLGAHRQLAALESLAGQRRTARRLQRLGAAVVLAAPDNLDGQVQRHYGSLLRRHRT